MGEVILLTAWPSPYGMRASMALTAKGVEHERSEEKLGKEKSQRLLEANPVYGKIPVLIHNGNPVCESSIIVQYVDLAWPSSPDSNLLPSEPYQRCQALFWGDFIDKKIFDVAILIPRKFFQSRTRAIKELRRNFATLEDALWKQSPSMTFFGGATPGYVDIMLAPFLAWHEAFEALGGFTLKLETQEGFPKLAAWKQGMESSPLASCLPEPLKLKKFALAMRRRIIKQMLFGWLWPFPSLFSKDDKKGRDV